MTIAAKITLENNLMYIEAMPKTLDLLDEKFAFDDFSLCFMGGSFKRENIKKRHFLIRKKEVKTAALLPIGFKQDLEAFLKKVNAKYKFIDKRNFEEFEHSDEKIKNSLGYLTLYEDQINAVQTCLREKSGIVKSPTGSGKTELMITLCKLINKPTLILFAKIKLAHQTMERMIKAGLDAGIVQGNNLDEDHLIVMATVQSGHKLNRKDYEVIIVDETHRAAADQYQDLIKANIFKYRFGFSATPWVKDKYKNAKVKAFLGSEICEVHPKELIEKERIAKPIIHYYPINSPRGLENYKWMGAENNGIIRNKHRNKVISKLVETMKGQVLIMIKRIEQGEILNKLIPGSIFLYGDTEQKLIDETVKRFDAGEDFVLIASTIFDEGIDIKSINHVILAGGGASLVKILQRIGRGTRILRDDKGNIIKNTVDVHDFMDTTNPILEKQSKERMKICRKYGYEEIIEHDISDVIKMVGVK